MLNKVKSHLFVGKTILSYLVSFIFILGAVSIGAEETMLFIDDESEWKYYDQGDIGDADWKNQSFDDTNWSTGYGEFGFQLDEPDEPNENTQLTPGYITYYFRKSFEIDNLDAYTNLYIYLLCDDGAVVWLNGEELCRSNMPDDNISYDTYAVDNITSDDDDNRETQFQKITVSSSDLNAGENIIAVEVHQHENGMDDLSFDLRFANLDDVMRKAPYLIYREYEDDNEVQCREIQILCQLYSSAESCSFYWGTDDSCSNGPFAMNSFGTDFQYCYTIDNLTPGELYYYQVTVTDEEQEYEGSFRASPADNATTTKFFVYGDTRSHPEVHDEVAADIIANYADDTWQTCVISVGDLIDDGNLEDAWNSEFFDPSYLNIQEMLATMPYQSCIGNHEDNGDGELFRKYFDYPYEGPDGTHYWSFDYGPALFVYLDQYQADYAHGDAQYNWIESTLNNSDKKWKFIVLHEPGWGWKDPPQPEGRRPHLNNTNVQTLHNLLFKKLGVSFVFGGHNHFYARAEVDGVQHITTGGGGAPLVGAPLIGDPDYPNIVASASAHHYCRVEIVDDILTFEAFNLAEGEPAFDTITTHGFKCFKEGWNWLSFPRLIEQGEYNNDIYQQAYYDNGLSGLLQEAADGEPTITGFQEILGSRGVNKISIQYNWNVFDDDNFDNMLFRHEGYKVKVADGAGPSAIVAAGERLPADYTFPLLYGIQNRGENWMGYFLPETHMFDDAIGNIHWNKVVSIKAQDWYYNVEAGIASSRIRPLEYGEMYIIRFSEDISNFKWNQNIGVEPVEPFVRQKPEYFEYEEKADYEV
ncbi:MAG: hypothetical protein HN334_02035, partial [Candidatus Cloacimonetes bacterium]|nr:hypothetical protein [Candidatus Cloacimonadota bacterium]